MDSFFDTFAPNVSMYNPPGAAPITGQEAIRQVAQRFMPPYGEMNSTQDRVFISGNGVVVLYTAQFTSKNGRTSSVQGIDIFEVNDQGKIQVIRYYWNPTPVMAVLRDEDSEAESGICSSRIGRPAQYFPRLSGPGGESRIGFAPALVCLLLVCTQQLGWCPTYSTLCSLPRQMLPKPMC